MSKVIKEKQETQDRNKFVSLMVRDKKTSIKERKGANRKDVGPSNWTILETKPITAKALIRLRAKRQKLLDEGKDVILTRTVLKPDDSKYGVSRRQLRASRRAFRPMQRMMRRRQARLEVQLENEFKGHEESEALKV